MNFKRGFLTTAKARDAIARVAPPDPTPAAFSQKPESQYSAERDEADSMDGEEAMNAPAVNLHKLPPNIRAALDAKGNDTTRYVFRSWPRHPNGKPAGVLNPKHGKCAGNGIPIWGDNLYSFFRTRKIPQTIHVETYTSGSIMADRMREFGELDYAESEIAWADREKDPRQVFPCDIGDLIQDVEENSFLPLPPPTLQNRIPLHLLPKKLIVHAPKSLLGVRNLKRDLDPEEDIPTYDENEPEMTFEYSLSLSEEGQKKMKEEEAAAVEAEELRQAEEADLWREFMPYVEKSGPTDERLILAKIPPRPPHPTSVEEAQLYISHAKMCGIGHHSVVYGVNWELPRRLLVKDVLCEACFVKAVEEEVEKSKGAGEWELEPGEEPPTITITKTIVETDEMVLSRGKSTMKGKERADQANLGSSTDVLDPTTPPPPTRDGNTDDNREYSDEEIMRRADSPIHEETYLTPKLEIRTHHSYKGPVIRVYPDVAWQNENSDSLCSHLSQRRKGAQISPTTRVSVVAKLSKENDQHLEREAANYEAFPSHFSEHWSGYNILSPLHDPFPIGALVPQFYGHYVPDCVEMGSDEEPEMGNGSDAEMETSSTSQPKPSSYLSPILLLESCGTPVDNTQDLSTEDRQECLSLLLRFHHEDWWHGSFAGRNFLRQPGPLADWPAFQCARDPRVTSCRLIDFGRSSRYNVEKIREERDDALRMLRLLHHSVDVET